ncbi:PTS sugar transporter subunit IIB [Spiroplasma clarkii]|uniref:PTS system, sugar-specific IIB component n=1 Tax=Spiroplasma clarkii TaxID=2139 RepID=A0A2K8KHF7_9MOLU|nr:PTS sugar transporter subunit IIB [Spiroplasma clarkii]ATX71123.1 PTS system, sugar-specific IIB component [Spiroplasma clarkii]
MKKILLACNAGMSTSLLVNKMKAAATKNLAVEIEAVPVSEAVQILEGWDCVLLGPQVGHELAKFKRATRNLDITVEIISAQNYGRVDGEAVLNQALSIIKD